MDISSLVGTHVVLDCLSDRTQRPDYAAHSGQTVLVVRERDSEEADGHEQAYLVRAADGWEGTAWASELSTPGALSGPGSRQQSQHIASDPAPARWIEPGAFPRLRTLHAFLLGLRDRDVDTSLPNIYTQHSVGEFSSATVLQAGTTVTGVIGWMCAVPEFNEIGLKGVPVGVDGGNRVFALELTDSAGDKLQGWEAVRAFFGLEDHEVRLLFRGEAQSLRFLRPRLDEATHFHDLGMGERWERMTDRKLAMMCIRNWLFWAGAINIDDYCAMANREEAAAADPVELVIDVKADSDELPVPLYAVLKLDDALYDAVRRMARICRDFRLAAAVRDVDIAWGPDSVTKDPSRVDLPQLLVDSYGGFHFQGKSYYGEHGMRTESLDLHHVQKLVEGAKPGEQRFSSPEVRDRFLEANGQSSEEDRAADDGSAVATQEVAS